MAEGVLLVFHLPEGSPSVRHREFRRRVYGEATSSWGGKYRYHRQGILDGVPHVRIYWGIIVVRTADGGKMARWLRKQGARTIVRAVTLTSKDEARLGS
ncbi:MAG: hypothetical protein ACREDE_04640 [Thermoplasmata archaeon]